MIKHNLLKLRTFVLTGAVIGSLSIVMPATAQDGVSWDYVAGTLLVDGEFNDGDVDMAQGYRLEGAASIGDYAFFRSRVDNHAIDASPETGVDTQEWGIGGHVPIHAGAVSISPWGAVSYERLNFQGTLLDGVSASLGIRAQFLNGDLEAALTGKTGKTDTNDGNEVDVDAIELSAAYRVVSNIDVTLSYSNISFGNDLDVDIDDVIGVGVRFRF